MNEKKHKHRIHIKKIKVFFSFFAVLWMATIVYVAHDRTLEKKTAEFEREAQYLRYRVELADEGESPARNALVLALDALNFFKSPDGISRSSAAQNEPEVAHSLPVFVYHGIVSEQDRFSMTPETFKEQMFALKRAGYDAIGLEDLERFMDGEALNGKPFLLTFDDGRADSFRGADPVLRALGWKAVMFIATGQSFPDEVANNYYLIGDEITEMVETGRWEIGSHAVQRNGGFIPISPTEEGNFLSNRMWLDAENRFETGDEYASRVAGELSFSRDKLEGILGTSIKAFSFPFGDYGQQGKNLSDKDAVTIVRETVQDNYEFAFLQTWPGDSNFSFNYSDDDSLALRRIEPGSDWTPERLLSVIKRAEAKNLPYIDSLTIDNGWKNPWGEMVIDEQGLTLRTLNGTTGSFVLLDGTGHWKDYGYSVKTVWRQGGYLTLFARYKDGDNYAACTFGDNLVKAEQKVEGEIEKLVETRNPISVPSENGAYAIVVSGSQIRCYEGAAVAVVSFRLDGRLRNGGIGLRIWDRAPNNGDISFLSFSAVHSVDSRELINSLPLFRKN